MLTLLTPSKTMDFAAPAPSFAVATTPVFQTEATAIRAQLAGYSVDELEKLMHISTPLAEKVQAMYRSMATKQAIWAYNGDVFKGVKAGTLTEADARFAQRHILVPSAVYGLVRPFDAIAPYRLEMKAKLAVGDAPSVAEFWGERAAQYIASYRQKELLLLSSKEYSQPVLRHVLPDIRVVTPLFLDTKPSGEIGQVPIYSKMMRGVMARWVIDQRCDSADDVVRFQAHGYRYDAAHSAPDAPAFRREYMTPLKFD